MCGNAAAGLGPVTQQPFTGSVRLHHGQRPQRQPCGLGIGRQRQILLNTGLLRRRNILLPQGIQPRGRACQHPLHLHATSRCCDGLQRGAILKVARNPAALHQDHAAICQLQRRQHIKTGAPLHLAVVQIHRIASEPLSLKLNATVQPRSSIATILQIVRKTLAEQVRIQQGRLCLCLRCCVQLLFLRRPIQLPQTQRNAQQHPTDATQRGDPPPQVAPLARHTGLPIMDGMTYAIALFLLAIVVCLASAGFFMLRKSDAHSDEQRSKNMARALTVRVLLSVVLFVCLLLAWKLGYIQPTGLPVSR